MHYEIPLTADINLTKTPREAPGFSRGCLYAASPHPACTYPPVVARLGGRPPSLPRTLMDPPSP